MARAGGPSFLSLLRQQNLSGAVRDALWTEALDNVQLVSMLRDHPPEAPALRVFAALETGRPVDPELTLELLRSRHPRARAELSRSPHREQAGDLQL